MKFVCTQENLNGGLSVVGHLSTKNINLPILNNILMEVKEDYIKLSTTNLEIAITCIVRGKVDKLGKFTVDSKLLADYVALLPRENVEISLVENDFLKVDCKNFHTKVKGIVAEDFPIIPEISKENFIKVNLADLRNALSQTAFAISSSETRQELSGVLFKLDGVNLVLAATDSYRLAEKKITINESTIKEPRKILVPSKTIQELLRILNAQKEVNEKSELVIYVSENQILFTFDLIELVSRVIEAQFPEYEQIIPTSFKTTTFVDKAELAKIIKTSALFAKTGIFDVNLDFVQKTNGLLVSSSNAQTGESMAELDVEFTGEDNKISLNYRYLLDGLNNISADVVEISMIDNNKPLLVKPRDSKDYVYIVMPIRQ
ncbi:DNA polymerase III subunit beta [Candidatus Falkowbacteria bacterium]|nr:DNA polymerase III subunit beta [Candidatus Falkowbacteria bacterium]